jgi:hypothetical protein
MLIQHIALVSHTSEISDDRLAVVGAALQKQATRDLGPIWGVKATVDVFPKLKNVPVGYWPIVIKNKIDDPEAAGYHTTKHGQPFALVAYAEDWTITCSHEMLEMLVDPFGNRLANSDSIIPGQGRAQYLVEVCDPSEDDGFGYTINGEKMSDFYTPDYFDPVFTNSARYSFTGFIKKPKEVLKNGYLSWYLPAEDEWWQASFFGRKLKFENITEDLSRIKGATLRSKMDRLSIRSRMTIKSTAASYNAAAKKIQQASKDSTNNADRLAQEINRACNRK